MPRKPSLTPQSLYIRSQQVLALSVAQSLMRCFTYKMLLTDKIRLTQMLPFSSFLKGLV